MKDFLMSRLIGTALVLISMVIVAVVGSELGVWTWLLAIPISVGLMLAVGEL